MSDLVERVARHVCLSEIGEPGDPKKFCCNGLGASWCQFPDIDWPSFCLTARDIIALILDDMREPSISMVRKGQNVSPHVDYHAPTLADHDVKWRWQAMLTQYRKQVLKESK